MGQTPETFLERALPLIRLGYYVTPLDVREKKPSLLGWQNAPSNDEAQIRKWATQYPHANVGIVQSKSGTWGIDVDDVDWCLRNTPLFDLINGKNFREEHKGMTRAEHLSAHAKSVADFVKCETTVKTGSGKYHVHFLHDEHSRANLKNHDVPHPAGTPGGTVNVFEIKHHGTQLVAPGSIHPNGRAYEWFEGCTGVPKVAPKCLVDWLTAQIAGKCSTGTTRTNHDGTHPELDPDFEINGFLDWLGIPVVNQHVSGEVTYFHLAFCPFGRSTRQCTTTTKIALGSTLGFKCHSARCEGRTIKDVLRWARENGRGECPVPMWKPDPTVYLGSKSVFGPDVLSSNAFTETFFGRDLL